MAAIFGTVGWVFASNAEAAKSWPTTEGVVVTNYISWYDYRDPKSGQTSKRAIRTFEYSYEVDAQRLTGTRYNVTGAGGPDEAYVPVGSKVTVHYDPAEPTTAGLNVDPLGENPWWYIATAGITALGMVFAFFGVRSWLRWRAAMRAPAQVP